MLRNIKRLQLGCFKPQIKVTRPVVEHIMFKKALVHWENRT